jgi:hypothetical protein
MLLSGNLRSFESKAMNKQTGVVLNYQRKYNKSGTACYLEGLMSFEFYRHFTITNVH